MEVKLPPPPWGSIELVPGFSVALRRKPSWWHRFWMRALLGWRVRPRP